MRSIRRKGAFPCYGLANWLCKGPHRHNFMFCGRVSFLTYSIGYTSVKLYLQALKIKFQINVHVPQNTLIFFHWKCKRRSCSACWAQMDGTRDVAANQTYGSPVLSRVQNPSLLITVLKKKLEPSLDHLKNTLNNLI